MALILSLETTTTNCSVALARDGILLALEEDMGLDYSHSERLHSYILKVMASSSSKLADLDAVAVSKGPGSYTGLRIGVSSAKGFCFAHDIPLLAIDTLTSLANQVNLKKIDFIVPMLDARRMEVYSAVFDHHCKRLRETRAEILDQNSFEQYLTNGKTVFIGNGSEKFKEICSHPNAVFILGALPSSREMVPLAEAKYSASAFEDTAYFEPYYLKDFMISSPKVKN